MAIKLVKIKLIISLVLIIFLSVNSASASGNSTQAGTPRIAYIGGGYGTGVDVVNIDSMTIITTIPDAGGYRMVLSGDGRKLYSTSGSTQIYVTDAAADTLLMAFNPSKDGVNSSELEAIAIHPDGSRLFVFDESSTAMFVIDTETDTVLHASYLDVDETENAVVSPDGEFVFVIDNYYIAKISTDSLEIVEWVHIGNDGHGISISADGKKLYADGAGIEVFDADSMSVLDTIATTDGYYIETSRDGKRVYGVDEWKTLSVIDAAVDTLISNVTLSMGSARGVTTTQSGDLILVATSSGLISIDAVTLTEVSTLTGHYYQSIVFKDNQIPKLSALPDVVFDEDSSATIHFSDWFPFVDDPDDNDSTLLWTLTSKFGDSIYFKVQGDSVIFSAPPDWFAYDRDTIQVKVSDSFLSDSISLAVHVLPVNDPPMFVDFPDTVFLEIGQNDTLILSDYVVDIDDEDSTLVWGEMGCLVTDNIPCIFFSADTAFIFPESSEGSFEFIFVVSDTSGASASDTTILYVMKEVGIDNSELLPKEFTLSQNYPNPFNPQTTIKYSIPFQSDLSLVIYNLMGQEIIRWDEESVQAGYYEKKWNGVTRSGSSIASGVYFYRLQAGDFVQTKKMVLLK